MYGILAQLVEHLTFNQVVGGSTPPCLIYRLVAEKYDKRLGEALRGWGVFLWLCGRRCGLRMGAPAGDIP